MPPSQSKKSSKFSKGRGGVIGFLSDVKKKCRISKEVDPLLSTCQSLASLSSIYFLSFLNVNVTIDFFVFVLVSVFVLVVVKYCHFNVMTLTANEGTWVMEHSINIADN